MDLGQHVMRIIYKLDGTIDALMLDNGNIMDFKIFTEFQRLQLQETIRERSDRFPVKEDNLISFKEFKKKKKRRA